MPSPQWRVDDSNRAHHIVEVRQRLAHSHENDVVDLLAAFAFDRDDLIDNFVRLEVARKSFQTARAKFAAVGTTHLRRDADRSPVRSRSVKGGRCRNQNRFDQILIGESKKKLSGCVTRTEHSHDFELPKGIVGQLRANRAANRSFLRMKWPDAGKSNPRSAQRDSRLPELLQRVAQFGKSNRLDINPLCHRVVYRWGRAGSNMRIFTGEVQNWL